MQLYIHDCSLPSAVHIHDCYLSSTVRVIKLNPETAVYLPQKVPYIYIRFVLDLQNGKEEKGEGRERGIVHLCLL
jgi:hypothetical protein